MCNFLHDALFFRIFLQIEIILLFFDYPVLNL
jgi:hypothetical protein